MGVRKKEKGDCSYRNEERRQPVATMPTSQQCVLFINDVWCDDTGGETQMPMVLPCLPVADVH